MINKDEIKNFGLDLIWQIEMLESLICEKDPENFKMDNLKFEALKCRLFELLNLPRY